MLFIRVNGKCQIKDFGILMLGVLLNTKDALNGYI